MEKAIEKELIERLKSKAYGDAPLNVNEEIWQQVLDGEKGKEKELEDDDALRLEDDMFTEDEDEDEMEDEEELEEEWEDDEEGGREFLSDDDESGEDDLEDVEFAEVGPSLSPSLGRPSDSSDAFFISRMTKVVMQMPRTSRGQAARQGSHHHRRKRQSRWANGNQWRQSHNRNPRNNADVSSL